MGNSMAYPVLRTTDSATAYMQAKSLCALLAERDDEVGLFAVVFHGEDAQWDGWTDHHTVFVHVGKFGDLPRAQELAAHIGSKVLGEPHIGW
ncbi:hypothetical protein [Streptomyces sp. NPDC058579]|uniref:hypothetical protein n=1 Tax=Streptomyces sp. NPDC058579 TaxID=3346548 RepID=UPI00366313A5